MTDAVIRTGNGDIGALNPLVQITLISVRTFLIAYLSGFEVGRSRQVGHIDEN
jgi:hypothetical protein